MNEELNVLPTETKTEETLPEVAGNNTNVVKGVALAIGGATLIGAAVFLTIKLVKRHKAKKAESTVTVEETKTEEK